QDSAQHPWFHLWRLYRRSLLRLLCALPVGPRDPDGETLTLNLAALAPGQIYTASHVLCALISNYTVHDCTSISTSVILTNLILFFNPICKFRPSKIFFSFSISTSLSTSVI
ncbi:hypothetical protein EGW08_014264, partial [Elysia chlorotica]